MAETENNKVSIWKFASLVLIGAIVGYIIGRFELSTIDFNIDTKSEKTSDTEQEVSIDEETTELPILSLEGRPFLGNDEASMVVVVFNDYQSPFSNKFHKEMMEDLTKDYIDTGKIKLYNKDYPQEIHKNAFDTSLASYCANEQGRYWDLFNKVYEKNEDLMNTSDINAFLKGVGSEIGLNGAAFDECLNKNPYKRLIDSDIEEAKSFNVKNTPTIFINNQIVRKTPSDYRELTAILEDILN